MPPEPALFVADEPNRDAQVRVRGGTNGCAVLGSGLPDEAFRALAEMRLDPQWYEWDNATREWPGNEEEAAGLLGGYLERTTEGVKS